MLEFSDILVHRVIGSFAHNTPNGLAIASNLLEQANGANLLVPKRLDSTTLLLLSATSGNFHISEEAVDQQAVAIKQLLVRDRNSRADLLEGPVLLRIPPEGTSCINRIVVLLQRYQQEIDIVWRPRLIQCFNLWTRRNLSEKELSAIISVMTIGSSQRWIINGTGHVSSANVVQVHRSILQFFDQLKIWPLIQKPMDIPGGMYGLQENRFIEAVESEFDKEPMIRYLVYATFYGCLNCKQVSEVVQPINERWTVPKVTRMLHKAWRNVLDYMTD